MKNGLLARYNGYKVYFSINYHFSACSIYIYYIFPSWNASHNPAYFHNRARLGVPLPAFLEALIMVVTLEILQEAESGFRKL